MADQISVVGTVILMMIVDFKQMAVEFRDFFGLDSTQNFPTLSIAENKIYQADSQFEFTIIADAEWKYTDSVQAYYIHSENLHEIRIKESVYENARNGDLISLYSIVHEMSHWALINYFNLNLGIQEFGRLNPDLKMAFKAIHENITDLLTVLLVFSEDDLLKPHRAGDFDFDSFMSKRTLSLARTYCKKFVPKITAINKQTKSQRRIS